MQNLAKNPRHLFNLRKVNCQFISTSYQMGIMLGDPDFKPLFLLEQRLTAAN